MSEVQWKRLESNPSICNEYMRDLGVQSKQHRFVDVFSFDELPKNAIAFLVLFPMSIKNIESDTDDRAEFVEETNDVFFVKQSVPNACGTVAMLHALMNNLERLDVRVDSALQVYSEKCESLSVEERSKALEEDEQIADAHHVSADKGETKESEMAVPDLHFATLVCRSGKIWELDGRNHAAIAHGECDADNFRFHAASVVQKMMKKADSMMFSVLGLIEERANETEELAAESNDDFTQDFTDDALQLMQMGLGGDFETCLAILQQTKSLQAAIDALL